jgi:glutamate transport system permease protein
MPVLLMMLFILLVASTGAFWAVVLALGVYNGAIIGESLRAGLAALPRGQREAGLSLGLTRFQTKAFIEFPQAFRQMLPVIIAQLVVLLKDTSLGYIVGYNELIRTTMNNLSSSVGNRYLFTLFLVTLVIYLAVNLSLSAVARRVARRRTPGTIGPKDQITPTASIAVATSFTDNPEDKTTE